MKKFSILKERIRQYAAAENIDIKDIYKNTGISDGTLSNSSGLGEENLLKFFSHYQDANPAWFISGQGSMKLNKSEGELHNIAAEYNVAYGQPEADVNLPATVEALHKTIEAQERTIHSQEKTIKLLEYQVSTLEHHSRPEGDQHTPFRTI